MNKKLNHEVLRNMLEKGTLDKEFYSFILKDPYSIRNLHYKDNLGEPFGVIEKVVKLLDANAPGIFSLNVDLLENTHTVINTSIFAFSQFSKNIDYFASRVLNLNFSASVKILSHGDNFHILYNYIYSSEVEKISQGFFFAFTFCAVEKGVKLDISYLIPKLTEVGKEKIAFVENIYRKKERENTKQLTSLNANKLKIALFVSGQVRSDLDIHKRLSEVLIGNTESQVDLFFSSWRNKGVSQITEAKSPRFFTQEAKSLVHESLGGMQYLDLSYFNSLLFEKVKNIEISEVESSFSFCDNKFINIDDESCPPFSGMSNPEKMYYHNSSWIHKLGAEYFEKYDLIIKIRPDIEIKSLNVSSVLERISDFEFITDYKGEWIYKIWGLGVGDQVLMATPSIMTGLLGMYKLSGRDAFSKELLLDLQQPPYSGHINLAIRALELGFKPVTNNYFSIALHDGYKFSSEDVSQYLTFRGL